MNLKKSEYNKQHYEKNKDKKSEYNKKYHEKNKDKISIYNKKYSEENKDKLSAYRHKNKDRLSEYSKNYQKENKVKLNEYKRARRYGLSINEMQNLLNQSDNCPICNKKFGKKHIDHCHSTGKIRGVICPSCNTALGKFQDSIEILNNAIEYLEKV